MNRLVAILSVLLVMLTHAVAYGQEPIEVSPEEVIDTATNTYNLPLFRSDSLVNKEYTPYRHIISLPRQADSADVAYKSHKSFWRASAEIVGFNLSLWSLDRFVLKGQYSYISWKTIKANFKHGFDWDDDHLHTNMFDHPYSGSLYYNAARSNGYNFWQSELFAIGGSAMWEMFMEKEYPSTNDIIATPIGGAALGEVFYRTSELILDDRATGGERFGRELAAFVVDPVRGLNRILTGAAWKTRATSGRRFGIPPISVDLSVGGRLLTMIDDDGTAAGAVMELNVEYGDRYAPVSKTPYDYFSFLMELQGVKSQPFLGRVEIMGRLLSKEVFDNKKAHVNVGVYQQFDYFDSDTIRPERAKFLFPCSVPYKFGTPASVGCGIMFKYVPEKSMFIDGYLHLNGVVLAGVLTDFYRDYHRNYNWASGVAIKAGLNWAMVSDKISVRLANQHYSLYTWKGYDPKFNWSMTPEGAPVDVQGDSSTSKFNHFEASVNYRLFNRLYVTGGLDLYTRSTRYDQTVSMNNTVIYSPIIDSKQLGLHLMLTCKI